MVKFGFFFAVFSLHKYCRAVLTIDSDSAWNSASDGCLPTPRQYFLMVDTRNCSLSGTPKWSNFGLVLPFSLFTSIAGQIWIQIQIQHEILHQKDGSRRPGNISLGWILETVLCPVRLNGQFRIFFRDFCCYEAWPGSFEYRFRFSMKFCTRWMSPDAPAIFPYGWY